MQQPVIAVYDKKTGLYDSPFTVRHIGEAIREWDIVLKNEQTKFAKNPEDFDLKQIANFDYQSGEMTPIKPHLTLATGV